jgi:PilZ domain-containing protein
MAREDRRSTLLRHRFESVEQLKAHLHTVDGRTLLFFRDPTLGLGAGASVLLELTFAMSEQTRVVRASLVARSEGQGFWLAMANGHFARDVNDRGLVPRRTRRLGADRPLRIRRADGSEHLVTLLDLSIAGARIGGGLPRTIAPGSELDLRLASPELGLIPELGRATVVWTDEGEAGLTFDRALSTCRVSVGRMFQALQKEWEKARTVDHLSGCCASGGLIEPPVPRLRADGKNDVARAMTG